jgi:hypothetical protein
LRESLVVESLLVENVTCFQDIETGSSFLFFLFPETLSPTPFPPLLKVRNPETHQPVNDRETGLELKRQKPQIDLLWFPQKVRAVVLSSPSLPPSLPLSLFSLSLLSLLSLSLSLS